MDKISWLNKIWQWITHSQQSSPNTSQHNQAQADKMSLSAFYNKPSLVESSDFTKLATHGMSPHDISTQSNEVNFIGRETELTAVRQSLAQWRSQQGELTAVIAPFGAGISSFLAQLEHSIALNEQLCFISFIDAPLSAKSAIAQLCYCFGITAKPESITETIKLINQQPPHIMLIDDLHKLMRRSMGNYQALVTFATILMETRRQHCWILGCEYFVWQRLSSQYQITQFIPNIIRFDYFNESELALYVEQLKVHQHIPTAIEAKTPKQTSSSNETVQTDAAELVSLLNKELSSLHSYSGGHPKLAWILISDFLMLITQARENSETNGSGRQHLKSLDTSNLSACNDNNLFSLCEIYVHGGLTVTQHANIFALSIEKSTLTLEYLMRQGLLSAQYSTLDFAAHFYTITPALTKIVAQHLVNNNKLFMQ